MILKISMDVSGMKILARPVPMRISPGNLPNQLNSHGA